VYFLHDWAVRKSGHDTTYRLEKRCINLDTINLQSLLYKYKVDIATAMRCLMTSSSSRKTLILHCFPRASNCM